MRAQGDSRKRPRPRTCNRLADTAIQARTLLLTVQRGDPPLPCTGGRQAPVLDAHPSVTRCHLIFQGVYGAVNSSNFRVKQFTADASTLSTLAASSDITLRSTDI